MDGVRYLVEKFPDGFEVDQTMKMKSGSSGDDRQPEKWEQPSQWQLQSSSTAHLIPLTLKMNENERKWESERCCDAVCQRLSIAMCEYLRLAVHIWFSRRFHGPYLHTTLYVNQANLFNLSATTPHCIHHLHLHIVHTSSVDNSIQAFRPKSPDPPLTNI